MNIVYNEAIDKLIKINMLELQTLEESITKLNNNLDLVIANCEGQELDFITRNIVNNQKQMDKVLNVNKSYVEVLKDVKTDYNYQDNRMAEDIEHANPEK